MDWFSWLTKTGLESSLVYEYGLSFAHNELEEEDIVYFNHEFLQSMGISIAKHRLEILKLARREKGSRPRSMTRLIVAIKKTKRCFAEIIRSWTRRSNEDSSALALVPLPSNYRSRFRGAMMKRNKNNKLGVTKQVQQASATRLLLTNGSADSPVVVPGQRHGDVFSSPPVVYGLRKEEEKMDGWDDGYWSTGFEEIKWDTMFQDLKPT